MLQLSIRGEIRGRVTGIISLKSGLKPVGAFIAGMCVLIALVVCLLIPIVRSYSLSDVL